MVVELKQLAKKKVLKRTGPNGAITIWPIVFKILNLASLWNPFAGQNIIKTKDAVSINIGNFQFVVNVPSMMKIKI